jgi:hypothetical protein
LDAALVSQHLGAEILQVWSTARAGGWDEGLFMRFSCSVREHGREEIVMQHHKGLKGTKLIMWVGFMHAFRSTLVPILPLTFREIIQSWQAVFRQLTTS